MLELSQSVVPMQKCDSKYGEICVNRAIIITHRAEKYNMKSVFASGCFKTSCLPFVVISNVDI